MAKQCQFIKEDGAQCEGFTMENSEFCFSHNPESKDAKLEAVIKGGLAPKKITLNLPPVEVKTVTDVIILLEDTINQLRTGEIPSSNPANTIGFLCGHILKALEISKVENKLEAIDRIILERRMSEKQKR